MPGKQRKKEGVELNETALEKLTERDTELALQDYMNSVAPEGAKFYLYRIVAGRHRYVATHDGALTEEDILSDYGAGTYLIRANIAGKWVGSRRVDIEGRESKDTTSAFVPVDSNGGANVAVQLQMMQLQNQMFQEQSQRTHEIMIAMIQNMGKGSASFDPAALMGSLFSGVTAIKTLSDGGNGRDPLDQVDKILSIAERVSGNGGGGPKGTVEAILDTAGKFLPAIMAARGIQAPSEHPSDLPGWTPGSERTAEPRALPAPAPGPSAQEAIQHQIKLLWSRIENAAKKDMDPERLADTMMDLEELDDTAASTIIDSIEKTATFEDWQKVTGSIAPVLLPWFGRFYTAVKAAVGNEYVAETVTDKPKSEGGNGNAASDDTPKS